MMTVNEVSKIAGVSIRALHYYDQIGLLHPTETTESGYRLYDDTALERLQQILLFRELEFPLKEIAGIVNDRCFDRDKALRQQIELLTLKKERLEKLIDLACRIKAEGQSQKEDSPMDSGAPEGAGKGAAMDFTPFDTKKLKEYTKRAKAQWGRTDAYREYEERSRGRSEEEQQSASAGLMNIFVRFGAMMEEDAGSEAVQAQVKALQDYITENFYTCTPEILSGLGKMYGAGGEFTENIDRAGGEGCAAFAARAIEKYCEGR